MIKRFIDLPLSEIDQAAETAKYSGCHEIYNICGTAERYQDIKPEKYVLQIKTTNKCNANCEFCCNKNEHNRLEVSNDIYLKNLEQVVQTLMANDKLFRITITGGEPLVDKERVTGILNILNKYQIYYQLNTNGIELSNYVDKINESNLPSLCISRHDMDVEKMTQIFKVNKKFDVFDSLKKLSPDKEVCIAFTLTDFNKVNEHIQTALEELDKQGIYYVAFNLDMYEPFEKTLQVIDNIESLPDVVTLLKRNSLYCACSNFIYKNRVAFYVKHLDLNRYNRILKDNSNFQPVKLIFQPDGKLYSEFIQEEKYLIDVNDI